MFLARDHHVRNVDFLVTETRSYGADYAWLVLVDDDHHLTFGDHVHREAIDAQDAWPAVGVDRAEHTVRFTAGLLNTNSDDVADQARRRLRLVHLHQLDTAAAGN